MLMIIQQRIQNNLDLHTWGCPTRGYPFEVSKYLNHFSIETIMLLGCAPFFKTAYIHLLACTCSCMHGLCKQSHY